MKLFVLFCLVAGIGFSGGVRADESVLSRAEFTSSPDGATVMVAGQVRGVTPLKLHDLKPGSYHAVVSSPNYESEDVFFNLEAGGVYQHHSELSEVRALLLVTSEPTGADVSLDGLSFGETPRLVTTLAASQEYRFLLQKPGYLPRPFEVKFDGRKPVVIHENLILDSGVLNISTEPAEVKVTVNGVERGVTPLCVSDIPKGRTTVTFSKEGYEDVTRELKLNAGDVQDLFVKMEGIPGTLRLTAIPEGARFYVDGQPEGKGPVEINRIRPGEHQVRCEQEGYAPLERVVQVGFGQVCAEEFRLVNIMGRLELKTVPAGARVLVDGRFRGVTKHVDDTTEVSEIFMVENLSAGEHVITIQMEGFAEAVRHPVIETEKTRSLTVKMKRVFTADFEVVTTSGTVRGVLVKNSPEAIELEIKPGVTRSFQRHEIRSAGYIHTKIK